MATRGRWSKPLKGGGKKPSPRYQYTTGSDSHNKNPISSKYCIFVGTKQRNPFPYWVRGEDLKEHFSDCRDALVSAEIPQKVGCGFVTFSSKAAADAAIEKYDGTMLLDAHELHLEHCRESEPSRPSFTQSSEHETRSRFPLAGAETTDGGTDWKVYENRRSRKKLAETASMQHSEEHCTVFVGTKHGKKFPGYINSKHLQEHFSRFGAHVVHAMIVRDSSKQTRGYGLVTFSSKTVANSAIETLDGSIMLEEFELHLDIYRGKNKKLMQGALASSLPSLSVDPAQTHTQSSEMHPQEKVTPGKTKRKRTSISASSALKDTVVQQYPLHEPIKLETDFSGDSSSMGETNTCVANEPPVHSIDFQKAAVASCAYEDYHGDQSYARVVKMTASVASPENTATTSQEAYPTVQAGLTGIPVEHVISSSPLTEAGLQPPPPGYVCRPDPTFDPSSCDYANKGSVDKLQSSTLAHMDLPTYPMRSSEVPEYTINSREFPLNNVTAVNLSGIPEPQLDSKDSIPLRAYRVTTESKCAEQYSSRPLLPCSQLLHTKSPADFSASLARSSEPCPLADPSNSMVTTHDMAQHSSVMSGPSSFSPRPVQHPSRSTASIVIKGLNPLYSDDMVQMLLQKYCPHEKYPYSISKGGYQAIVDLANPLQAESVAAEIDGEEILGKTITVTVVVDKEKDLMSSHQDIPSPELAHPPILESNTERVHKELDHTSISNHLYHFITQNCPEQLKEYEREGGSIRQLEGGVVLEAPGSLLEKFRCATKVQESPMTISSEDMNRLTAVDGDGDSLFLKLSSNIHSTLKVELYLMPDQLTVLFIGKVKQIEGASKHLSATLAQELRVDPIKLEGLLFLVPKMDQEIQEKHGVKTMGFCKGSTEFSFKGPPDSLLQAKEEVEQRLSQLNVEQTVFRHHRHQVLVVSAQKRLQIEEIKAYLRCPDDLQATPPIQLLIVYRDDTDLLATLEIINNDPFEQSIVIPDETAITSVRNKMPKLERKHCVAIHIQQQNKVVICGFVLKDVEITQEKILRRLQNLAMTDVPLKCSEDENAYLDIALFKNPTQEGKALLDSLLPVKVAFSNGRIVLSGAAQAISTAQTCIHESPVLQGLLFRQFTFTCHENFCNQIEKCVLKPMRREKQLKVSYHCKRFPKQRTAFTSDNESPPTFLIALSSRSNHSDDFQKACKELQALNPHSAQRRIPPNAMAKVAGILEQLASRDEHRTIVHPCNHGVLIHGLCDEDIEATWLDIEEILDSTTRTKRNISVDFFEAKYIVMKHFQKVNEMRKKCNILLPKINKLAPVGRCLQDMVISVAGTVKDVKEVESRLKEIYSHVKVDQFQIHCPCKNVRVWQKRWEKFCGEQEEHNVLIEFQKEMPSVELRNPSEKPRSDGASVTFSVYGTDVERMKAVRQLIVDVENGQTLAEKQFVVSEFQMKTLQRGLIQNKLNPEAKYPILMELGSKAVTLKAPPSKEFEAVLCEAEAEILEFIKANEQLKEMYPFGDPLVGMLLTSSTLKHYDEVLKVAKENKVFIRTIKTADHQIVLELKSTPVGIAGIKKALQSLTESVHRTICKDRVIAQPFQVPVFSNPEFIQFVSQLEKDLCIECSDPSRAATIRNKVVKEFSFQALNTLRIQICQGDLTLECVDAIVNAANEDLEHAGGLAKAITQVGGASIQSESRRHVEIHGKVPPGNAVCLSSGRLPCMRVIHAVGPRWSGGGKGEHKTLFSAFYHSLTCAEAMKLESISFPAIGAGIFEVPLNVCAEEGKRAVLKFQTDHPFTDISLVRFLLLTQKDVEVFVKEFSTCEDSVLTTHITSPKATPKVVSRGKEPSVSSPTVIPAYQQQYQWCWENDSGSYSPYPPHIYDSLSDEFSKSPNGSYTCTSNGKHYQINFQSMVQTNLTTGYRRNVRRSLLAPKYDTAVSAAAIAEDSYSVQWYYRDDMNQFSPYSPTDSSELERMYRGRTKKHTLKINRQHYTFDFNQMVQINLSTRTARDIKREKEEEEEKEEEQEELTEDTAVIIIRGTSESVNDAKAKITDKLASLTKEYKRELPLGVGASFVEMLKAIARENAVICHIKCEGAATEAADSDEQESVKRVLTLKGPQESVDKVITIQDKIIHEFQSQARQTSGAKVAFPPEWEAQSKDCEMFDVKCGTPEWSRIEGKFKETMPHAAIAFIRRIQNKILWERYSQAKARLHLKNSGKVNEMELFHGSRQNDPEQIYSSEEGFDMRFSNQGMWGQANYFAANASYSDSYAHSSSLQHFPSLAYSSRSHGEKEMFLAKVLTGDSFSSSPNGRLRMPPEKDGSGASLELKQVRYDTVNGTASGSTVYMTYSNDLAYPAYLISYSVAAQRYTFY